MIEFVADDLMVLNPDNPCLTCGACCAFARVSFYWTEADPESGGLTPPELTEAILPHRRCMKGTNAKPPRCIALRGEVGQAIHCEIYALRPSPCREFGIQWNDGRITVPEGELERCNHARALNHLPPLRFD